MYITTLYIICTPLNGTYKYAYYTCTHAQYSRGTYIVYLYTLTCTSQHYMYVCTPLNGTYKYAYTCIAHTTYMFTLHTHLMYVGTLDQLFIQSIIELLFKQLINTYTHLDPRVCTDTIHRHKLFTWHFVCVVFLAMNFIRRYIH